MAEEYVFTMLGLNKYYDKRHVLKDIGLSFFHGAKIGIVGDNGAGKTTLLRIMALQDKDFEGRAEPMPGVKIGFVEQEPRLDLEGTVRSNLEDAYGDLLAKIAEYEQIGEKMGEMDADEMEKAQEAADSGQRQR